MKLVEKGIRADKIRVYPRGIDIERFTPRKAQRRSWQVVRHRFGNDVHLRRTGFQRKEPAPAGRGFPPAGGPKTAARSISSCVGDGPYCDEMQRDMKDLPCFFTGYLTGDLLPQVYASADPVRFPQRHRHLRQCRARSPGVGPAGDRHRPGRTPARMWLDGENRAGGGSRQHPCPAGRHARPGATSPQTRCLWAKPPAITWKRALLKPLF